MSATWALLRQDKDSSAAADRQRLGILAAGIFFVPGYGIGWLVNGHEQGKIAYYAGAALAGLGATIVGVFFQTARSAPRSEPRVTSPPASLP